MYIYPQPNMACSTLVYIHELVVRARQLDAVAQLVRALHRNRKAAGSIPASDLKLHLKLGLLFNRVR